MERERLLGQVFTTALTLGFQIQGKLFNRLTDNMFRLKGIQNKNLL